MREAPTISGGAFQRFRTDFAVALLAILYFVLPLYRAPYLENSFITPKIAFAHALVLPLLAILLTRFFKRRVRPLRISSTDIALGVFLAVNAASIIYAGSRYLALYATCYFITFFLLYLCCRFLIRDFDALKAILSAGIGAAIITAIWTVIEDAFRRTGLGGIVPLLEDWRGYLAAGLGNSGHIAGFIGLFLPATLIFFLRSKRVQYPLLLGIFIMFAALIVTWSIGSTGSTLLAIAGAAIVAVRSNVRTELHWKRIYLVLVAGIAAMLLYFTPNPANPHYPSLWTEAFHSQRWKEGGPTRLVIWETTIHMLHKAPWLGVGTGNFTYAYVQQIVPSVLNDPELRFYAGSFTNEAHNEYLQVWNETGIAGLLAYLGVFVCFFINARARFRMQSLDEKLLQISAGASVCVFLLDSLMSFPLRLPSHIAVLMLMLSVPEMDLGETDDATASKFKAGKSWVILMAVAALLIAPVYLKRVGAEYWMKQARTAAESDPVMLGGSVVPVWSAMENEFRTGAMAFSSGNQSVAFPVFAQVRSLAQHPGIKQAAVLFARSLAWDDHYSNASSRYGALLLYEGNYKASIKYLNQALRDLEAFEIHERLGFAYYFSGDFAKAKTEWTICRNRRPALSDYYSGLLKQIKK